MKKDIILCGVGGQGILSIATVIGEAATNAGIQLKQAEVHGMSQRGGDVQSNLRLSTETIWSDLIPTGETDIIISMEPMEVLRYLGNLNKNGWVITSSNTFINIPNYPDEAKIMEALNKVQNLQKMAIEDIAKENKMPRSANMILLGMAAPYLEILTADQLRAAIRAIFEKKGETVVETNIKAFNIGYEYSNR